MAKQKTAQTRAEKTHEAKTAVEVEEITTMPEIVAIESAVDDLEDALASLETARAIMVTNGGSVSRIVAAKQHITEVLKTIKPYLND